MPALPRNVTFQSAPEALAAAAEALGRGEARFDLGGCAEFDSSLIGVLLELSRRAQAAGLRAVFDAPPANLRKLAGLYGVDALLFGEEAG